MNQSMDIASRLVGLVAACLRSLPDADRGLVVAVSGGADSIALLRAVLAARDTAGVGPIVVAHLNHQLRGVDSDADEAFVEELHGRLHVDYPELTLERCRMDVAAHAQAAGTNLEGTARHLRYRWLSEVARKHGRHWVATGHTADDQAETVLHRLLRGTGLQGLRGIAAERALEPNVRLVRPLLRVRRVEVEAYLHALRQSFRRDASNDDRSFTRNRIRNELLPLLAGEYNPGIIEVLNRLAVQADEYFRSEDEAAATLLQHAERPSAGAVLVFDRAALAAAPRQLVRVAFRRVWQREGWSMDTMNFAAWERLAGLVAGEIPAVDLPGGLRAVARATVVQITREP